MTIQEQANEILARTTTDTDELLLRLVQDRAALLKALKSIVDANNGNDSAVYELTRYQFDHAERAIAQAEQAPRATP